MTKARDSSCVLRGPHATFNRATLRAGAKSQKFGRSDQQPQDLQPYMPNPIGERTRPCSGSPLLRNGSATFGTTTMPVASNQKVADPRRRQSTDGPSRLGCVAWVPLRGYVNASNDCGFRAGMRYPLAIRSREISSSLHFLASPACKIEQMKNANCDAYHLPVTMFAGLAAGKERRTCG